MRTEISSCSPFSQGALGDAKQSCPVLRGASFSRRFFLPAFLCVLMCTIALCLSSCGKSSEADPDGGFGGTWSLYAYEEQDSSSVVGFEDVTALKEAGYPCSLAVNEDGSCVFDLFGNLCEGSWKLKGDTLKMSFDGFEMQALQTAVPEASVAGKAVSVSFETYRLVFVDRTEESKSETPEASGTSGTSSVGEANGGVSVQ